MTQNVSTSLDNSNELTSSSRLWAGIALGSAGVFLALFILLHFLRTDYNPLERFGSDYLHGEYSWMMLIAFFGLAVMYGSLAVAFHTAYEAPVHSWASIILLGFTAVTMILSGLFPDYSMFAGSRELTQQEIFSSAIHFFAGLLGFISLFIAMIKISNRLRKANLLNGRYRILFWLAVLAPIWFVLSMVFNIAFEALGTSGLRQRIFLTFMIGWAALMAYGIRTGAITESA